MKGIHTDCAVTTQLEKHPNDGWQFEFTECK